MRSNIMLGILVIALVLSSGAALVLAGVNFIAQRQLETTQQRAELIKTTLNAAQALANDSIRYSRDNPAIAAVLTNFSSQASRLQSPAVPIPIPIPGSADADDPPNSP